MINYNLSFVFKALRRGSIRSCHMMSCFFIQINSKLNIGVKSVTKVIVQNAKSTLKKFRVQSVTWGIV